MYAFVKRYLYMNVQIHVSLLSLEPGFHLFLSLHTKRHDLDRKYLSALLKNGGERHKSSRTGVRWVLFLPSTSPLTAQKYILGVVFSSQFNVPGFSYSNPFFH